MTLKGTSARKHQEAFIGQFAIWGLLALCWFVMALAASSRMYFLSSYEVGKMVDPVWEPLAAPNSVVAFCFAIAVAWVVGLRMNQQAGCGSQTRAVLFFGVSILPLLFWISRIVGPEAWSAQFWEVIWIGAWTGLSFGELARVRFEYESEKPPTSALRTRKLEVVFVAIISLLTCAWWFSQSVDFYQNFLLGFNDFGHFLQRVANTAEGRGMLLETPVLPMFWDHFNPGLMLLVPLWKIYPSVNLVFALQAAALSICAVLIFGISQKLGHSTLASVLFGLAWLAQPSVGQMNLAYTYGWHPITFAIPLLLAAIYCLMIKQRVAALICALLALSMEEGVFVIVALVGAVCAVLPWVEKKYLARSDAAKPQETNETNSGIIDSLTTVAWATVAVASVVGFVLVYKFSGLAEFQTGRFVALGNSTTEILLSPVIRPGAFWKQVLKFENFVFVALLWLPCGLPALLRGWRYLLPTLLPLGVLIVWDHKPAHNIAFQYPSTLLPMFWLATLSGATMVTAGIKKPSALPSAVTALVTGLVLSLFVGQLPFSSVSLRDVEAMTYGIGPELRRKSSDEDGRWLTEQVEKIRESKEECLATTRIAAHLVGNRDIETVGQYILRREKLAALPDRKGNPITHYRWVILDRKDSGAWSGAHTVEVENEARQNGFELVADQFNIGIYKRRDSAD